MCEVIKDRIKWVPRFRIRATCRISGEITQAEVHTIADAVFAAESFRKRGDCSAISVLDRKNGELIFHPTTRLTEVREA